MVKKVLRISIVLEEKEIEQKELARLIGVDPGTINGYCRHRKLPSILTLIKIAEALDVDITELFYPTKVKTK